MQDVCAVCVRVDGFGKRRGAHASRGRLQKLSPLTMATLPFDPQNRDALSLPTLATIEAPQLRAEDSAARGQARIETRRPVASADLSIARRGIGPTLKVLAIALLLVQVVRWLAMGFVPFLDTSEPRYAEVARLMAESGDWITPWFAPGVPFWGKPPLSFWAQALGIHWLGLGEFSSRLPGWVAMAVVAWLMHRMGQRALGTSAARWSLLVFATMLLPFVSAGAVLTDPFLALGVTWSLVAYYFLSLQASRRWGYGFFLGLSVGLLSKGPLAVVLVVGVVLAWCLWHRPARKALRRLPWVSGTALMLLLSAPWYVLAEIKTPGFLHYFLLGEHVLRFTDPGWAGDLYGSAHERAHGAIWLDGFLAGMPWTLLAAGWLASALARAPSRARLQSSVREGSIRYLLLWALATPALFTASSNILWTYVLPSCGALALLLGRALASSTAHWPRRTAGIVALVVPLLFAGLGTLSVLRPTYLKTEKFLVEAARDHAPAAGPLYFVGELPFSARYYSQDQARSVGLNAVPSMLSASQGDVLIAVRHAQAPALRNLAGAAPMELVRTSRRYALYRIATSAREAP